MAFRWLRFEFYSTEIWQINHEVSKEIPRVMSISAVWNRERFVIKYLEIFFLTLAAKWAAMIHSKYLKPFLLQFQYLNWNEYLECILDASNQKSSSFTPWSTFRLNWRPLIGSNQFREFSHVPVYQSTRLFGMY